MIKGGITASVKLDEAIEQCREEYNIGIMYSKISDFKGEEIMNEKSVGQTVADVMSVEVAKEVLKGLQEQIKCMQNYWGENDKRTEQHIAIQVVLERLDTVEKMLYYYR
jgi:hypothetical protein